MLSRAEAARISALQRRKTREREGLFIAEGVRVVEELLSSTIVLRSVVAAPSLGDTERGQALLARARGRCVVLESSESELARLTGTETPQGVLAVAEIPVRRLEDVDAAGSGPVLVLDAVQDPGNLGTLIRTADAFGTRVVIALPGTVDAWNPKVVRAAAGSLFRTAVVYTGVAAAARWLRSEGYHVFAADTGGAAADGLTRAARSALVVGNEGAGLSKDGAALADELVAIPMAGRAESLNVAIAAGILLYVLTRGNA